LLLLSSFTVDHTVADADVETTLHMAKRPQDDEDGAVQDVNEGGEALVVSKRARVDNDDKKIVTADVRTNWVVGLLCKGFASHGCW
jgi:hypothetical protein